MILIVWLYWQFPYIHIRTYMSKYMTKCVQNYLSVRRSFGYLVPEASFEINPWHVLLSPQQLSNRAPLLPLWNVYSKICLRQATQSYTSVFASCAVATPLLLALDRTRAAQRRLAGAKLGSTDSNSSGPNLNLCKFSFTNFVLCVCWIHLLFVLIRKALHFSLLVWRGVHSWQAGEVT